MGTTVLGHMPLVHLTVGDLINSVVTQVTGCFPDQDRLATAEDAILMLQTMMIVCRAFIERERGEE